MSDEPIMQSCCTISGAGYPETTALVTLTNGTRLESRDPFVMALVHEVLRYQCARMYVFRHLDGLCECAEDHLCWESIDGILRSTEGPRQPFPGPAPRATEGEQT